MLLSGFGMEDAHAFANSLQWGPDGWLYGAQGSTVTAHVRGLEFQQGIWRYHPRTKEFELFAEGGGNTWGLDFDAHGNVIAGTNWGGFAMLHQVQGGYYVKGFGKHGPLHNPHTYGYFDHVPYPNFKGGHVTCGGIVYQGGALPEKYETSTSPAICFPTRSCWYTFEPQGFDVHRKQAGDFLVGQRHLVPADRLPDRPGRRRLRRRLVRQAHQPRRSHRQLGPHQRPHLQGPDEGGQTGRTLLPLGKQSSKELVALLDDPNTGWSARRGAS